MADAVAQLLNAAAVAADNAYTVAHAATSAGELQAGIAPAALQALRDAEGVALAACVEARVAVQMHAAHGGAMVIRRKLDKKTPSERVGKRLTGHAHEAGTIHDDWDYIVHNVLPVLELPLDDHRCVAWLGGIFDKAAGKWWSHRVQTIPAIAAVPAVAAAGGNPAVAAVAARAAGGYATVAEMRDGFLDAFKFEPAHTVASRKFDTLKCTTHKHIHDFNTKFNQLYPVVRPGHNAAGGDGQLQHEYLGMLFLDMQ